MFVVYHEVVTLPSIIDFEHPKQTQCIIVVYQRLHKRLHCSSRGEHGDPALRGQAVFRGSVGFDQQNDLML